MIFFLVAALSLYAFTAWGSEIKKQASAQGYVDLVTMHRYISNSDGTYDEYTRKGEFFKTVSADLPLLSERSHVIPINNNCYLLYVKNRFSKQDKAVVLKSAPESHPEGWLLEKALVDVRHASPY
ncbi:MAG: hypothetical protein R6V15_05805 [Desulfotignum sp.]